MKFYERRFVVKEQIIEFLQDEIDKEHIPGAVIQVNYKGKTILKEALGWRIDFEEECEPMQLDTVFDLASLTKVVATLPSILKLLDEGEIGLNDTVSHFIPEFSVNNKSEITLMHLLTHTSGLKSHRRFYQENLNKEEIFEEIYEETLEYKPGTKVIYSDLGFMLLFKIIEIVTHSTFEEFVTKEIFEPLEMNETSFLPKFSKDRYAATEFDPSLKTYKLGVVHDENANTLGGISGHAGLFSTVSDLNHYVSMHENEGIFNGKRILSPNAIQLAQKNFTSSLNEMRGLGWQLKTDSATSCGDYFSKNSFGHTGFTGTSLWIDTEVDLSVILLTNRVHYGREPHILRLRPRLHNIIRQHFNQ